MHLLEEDEVLELLLQYLETIQYLCKYVYKGPDLITNQWIVPYNPRVLNEAHLNEEVVGSSATMKYLDNLMNNLDKYVSKGPDRR
jgi:hypothetical protein